jgi:hypothetical protein
VVVAAKNGNLKLRFTQLKKILMLEALRETIKQTQISSSKKLQGVKLRL